MRLAIDSVKSGSARNVMVVASDCRIGYPQSEDEQLFGDGAAAVVAQLPEIITSNIEIRTLGHCG